MNLMISADKRQRLSRFGIKKLYPFDNGESFVSALRSTNNKLTDRRNSIYDHTSCSHMRMHLLNVGVNIVTYTKQNIKSRAVLWCFD